MDRSKPQAEPLIGIHRAKLERTADGPMQIRFDGVSTAIWKEFETEWKIGWRDGSGHLLGTATTNVRVRARNTPAPFVVSVAVPSFPAGAAPERISVAGKVQHMAAAYRSRGWMKFIKPRKKREQPL